MKSPISLCTYTSRHGVGFILPQQTTADHLSLMQAGSYFLSGAESHYAIIKLELLAVAWAVTNCQMFITGLQHLQIITKCNPLIFILNSHQMDEIKTQD